MRLPPAELVAAVAAPPTGAKVDEDIMETPESGADMTECVSSVSAWTPVSRSNFNVSTCGKRNFTPILVFEPKHK